MAHSLGAAVRTAALVGLALALGAAAHEGHVHGTATAAAAGAEATHDMGGMDMGDGSMDMGGSEHVGGMAGMKMWVHGTIGDDLLWFKSWHPSGPGATVGVCIALFALSIFDRYLHAMWRACNAHWARGRVWFALPVARGELAYEDAGQVVMASASAASAAAAPQTGRGLARTRTSRSVPGNGEERRASGASAGSGPPEFTSCATRDETVLEKQTDACCGGGVPAACNCGCGGECGQASSPRYTLEPDASRGLDKGTAVAAPPTVTAGAYAYPANGGSARGGGSRGHLPGAVAAALDPGRAGRWSRPFRAAVDVPRGVMWTGITALHYALMLVVMTFQIWWIISVVVGAGVGEMLFGRFGATR